MTKFSVTRHGNVLDPSLYTWDENTKTFSTNENELVLDFTDVSGVTFNTGRYCTFLTGSSCTFDTSFGCTFKTSYGCTFNTGSYCTFKTDSHCTFDTGNSCIFNTGSSCTFNTENSCAFYTGPYCTFKTDSGCAFTTGPKCTFEVGDNCSLIRLDVKGVTEIPTGKKIKLNGEGIAGYAVIEEKKETTLSEPIKTIIAAFDLLANACDSGNPMEIGKAQIKGRSMISSATFNLVE
jgi:hypothetical protein